MASLTNGYEFELALGVGDGQGGLACCSPWSRKEWDTNEPLKNNNKVETKGIGSRAEPGALQYSEGWEDVKDHPTRQEQSYH